MSVARTVPFHLLVQAQLVGIEVAGLITKAERSITDTSGRHGRIDVFINMADDSAQATAVVYEVKGTNWETIGFHRIRPNVLRTARQIWRYIDALMDVEKFSSFQAFVTFPRPPADIWVRRVIEVVFAERGVMVEWQSVEVSPYEFLEAAEPGVDPLGVLLNYQVADGIKELAPAWVPKACGAGRSGVAMGHGPKQTPRARPRQKGATK